MSLHCCSSAPVLLRKRQQERGEERRSKAQAVLHPCNSVCILIPPRHPSWQHHPSLQHFPACAVIPGWVSSVFMALIPRQCSGTAIPYLLFQSSTPQPSSATAEQNQSRAICLPRPSLTHCPLKITEQGSSASGQMQMD